MRPLVTARRHVALLRQHHRARPLGVVALHLGDVVGPVHVPEVRRVHTVLGHLLGHRVDQVARPVALAPRRVAHLGDLGDLPLRLDAVRVAPRHHHPVAHHDGVRAEPGLAVDPLRVRDLHAAAFAVERPAVERALERGADDLAPDAEVRAEVRAVGVLEVELAVLVAPEHEVGAPVPQRGGRTGREVLRVGDLEPAEGVWEREVTVHAFDSRTCSHSTAVGPNRSLLGSSV